MELAQYIGLVRDFGVPVFMLAWFMFRLEKRVDRMQETLAEVARHLRDM